MKHTTKKIVSVLLVLSVLFLFSACDENFTETTGSSSFEENQTTGSEETTETSDTTSTEETTDSSESTSTEETTGSSESTSTEETTGSSESTSTEETTESTEESSFPHAHTFGEWTVTKEATCTKDGEQERSCSCGEKETQTVKASGHVILTESAKLPTCTEQGFTEKQTCSVCGETLKQSETVPAKGHAWNNGIVTKEPTETETGILTFTCSSCNETKTSEMPVLAHTHKYEAEVTYPTCTEKGFTTFICACGDSYVDNHTEAKGHTETIIAGKDATCTESGLTEGKKCSVCGEILLEREPTALLGHRWGEGIVTKQPTETETGIRTYTCKTCGETKTETIGILIHTHQYQPVVTKPTCTEQGYTTYTCACGEHYTGNYADATGHSMGAWTQTKAPTCTEKGSQKRTCANCAHFETGEIAATGHNHKATVTKPTCTKKGYTTYTCACGHSYKGNEVNAKGHTETVKKGISATCLKTGLTDKIFCSVCQTVLQEQTLIPKKDHLFYADGCSVCGMTFADNDGYLCLGTLPNGANLQKFYNELDCIAKEFQTSGKDLVCENGNFAMLAAIREEDFGISMEEAELVFLYYRNDHPYYFWFQIYATLDYEESGNLISSDFALIIPKEYCLAADRAKYEKQVLDTLKEYLALVKDEDSAYEIALAFHDKIILETMYSVGEDLYALWAHSIIGSMVKGNGVCETYAKTFQLLLNCAGIENIFVNGYGVSGGTKTEHVWNLIQLDNGKWYWCDLTWDDGENYPVGWGVRHDYFCVNDTQNTNHYRDAGYGKDCNGNGRLDPDDISVFLAEHLIDSYYRLPARAETAYDGSLRDVFAVNDLQFAISGYRTVQFVLTMKTGIIDIPETVEYNGVIYTVTSVGRIKADGSYTTGPVANPNSAILNLPKTVIYIWPNALPKS